MFSFEIPFFCFTVKMVKSPLHSHMLTFSKLHFFVKMLSVLWNESALVLEPKDANTDEWRCRSGDYWPVSARPQPDTLCPLGLPHSRALACLVQKPSLARKPSLTAAPQLPCTHSRTLLRLHSATSSLLDRDQMFPALQAFTDCLVCSTSMDVTTPFFQAHQEANKVPHTIVLSM